LMSNWSESESSRSIARDEITHSRWASSEALVLFGCLA
jgi:hypothetical protein